MPDGKIRAYYWDTFTALAEIADLTVYPSSPHTQGQEARKGVDKALPLDVPRVDFATVLSKIQRLKSQTR